jgi:hypothetical protein
MFLEHEGMTTRIDELLGRLKALPRDHELDRLESAVFARIDAQRDAFAGKTLHVQLAVTCGALLLGLAVAQFARIETMTMPLHSELVVLSDDSALAPSVLLEGGT